MSEPGEFVSVFRRNGRPILPPVMTPVRRAEMQQYKLKALEIEKKLLEKKNIKERNKIKSDISKSETSTGGREDSVKVAFITGKKSIDKEILNREEEDKENDSFNIENKSVDTSMSAARAFKFPLSERAFPHSNNSDSELYPIAAKEPAIVDEQPEDEVCSVVPTDSTDLQQYLDSTLGDVSPEVGSNFDHSENVYFVGNDQDEKEAIPHVSALLALESKLASLRFSPVIDLSKDIPELILQGRSNSFSNPVGERSNERVKIVSVETPNFQGSRIECTPVPCLTVTSSYDRDAKEVEPSSVDDSVGKKSSVATSSEIKTVPSSFGDNSPKSPPKLVRRGSYTLDSPSPTLLANIHKYSIDDLPKSGIHSEASLDVGQGKEVQPSEKKALENASDNVKILEKRNKSHFESSAKTKTSKLATKGRSVFERLAADAARKVEARKKSVKEGTFKVPEIKKVSKSIKGLRSAVSINNIRASVTEAHKKRSGLSAERRCNSDVNIPYTVVRAISSKSNSAASTQSLKRQSSVDLNEAPPPQKSPSHNAAKVDAIAAQKRKRRRWSERWEGWTKAIEPIHRNTSSIQGLGEGEKVLADVEVAKGSESLEETPKLNTDKSGNTQNDHLTEVNMEEKEIDSCLNNMSGIKDVNKNLSVKVPESNDTLVDGKDMGCLTENVPMKEKKDNDNLLIAKQSSQVSHSPTEFPDIQDNNMPLSGGEEIKSLNDIQKQTPEVNVIHIINEERMLNNDCQIPETPIQLPETPPVSSESVRMLESGSTITESACAADTSFDLSLKSSPDKHLINADGPSSTRKIPLDLQRTIESLPGTPIGRHTAKDMALNILSRVIEEQDKAMQNLLAENRKREENVQKKFQEQLKYLVGKLTRLVQAMPSPQVKDDSGVQISQKSKSESNNVSNNEDICLLTPSSTIRGTQSPSQPNMNCGKSLEVASTPCPFTGEKEKPLSSPIPELVTLPCNHENSKCTIGLEDKTSDTNENQNDTLRSSSVLEDIINVTCSPCQKSSASSKSCSSFVGETSIHSSTLKDDSKAIKETNDGKSDAVEYFSLREEDVTNLSQGREQKRSQRLSNKEFYDSNSEVTLHDLKSSTAIEGCKCQNADLDLSGILEMEYQGKNNSYLTTQLVPCNPLHETCSSSLSSVTDSKVQMNYGFLIDELSLHRKKYEEDVLRLNIAESTPRGPSKMFSASEASITPFSARKDGEMEECQIYTKKSLTECVTKSGIQSSIRTELPDLKSDLMALRTYLGAETPSTGPVTLETPLSTPLCILEGTRDSHIDCGNQLAAHVNLNVSQDQTKKIDFLHLKPNGEENEMDLGCDLPALMPSIRLSSPGRKSESLTEAKYLTPESCSSSVNYVSAMSGSLVCHTLGDDSNPDNKKGCSRLSALVKGYLTRRLLKTARVLGIKATIQDSIETALKLHSEVSEEQDVAAADVFLHGRILAQLSAASNELHHIFFELPVKEQMAIISNDRQRLQSRNSTPTMYDPLVAPSPRPALLSAVTLKTLQRRFGNEIPVTKDAAVVPVKKKECTKLKEKSVAANNAKFNSAKLGDSSNHQRPTRAKSFTSHSARQSVKKTSEVTRNTIVLSALRKTVNGKVQPKTNKKTRRSSSTGEINRRPWR